MHITAQFMNDRLDISNLNWQKMCWFEKSEYLGIDHCKSKIFVFNRDLMFHPVFWLRIHSLHTESGFVLQNISQVWDKLAIILWFSMRQNIKYSILYYIQCYDSFQFILRNDHYSSSTLYYLKRDSIGLMSVAFEFISVPLQVQVQANTKYRINWYWKLCNFWTTIMIVQCFGKSKI